MAYWAARTQPQREATAHRFLTMAGFTPYWPRLAPARGGRPVSLFPNYLFIPVMDRWYDINRTPGVSKLVMGADGPARLSDAVVDEIRARENAHGVINLPPRPPMQRGDRVRITHGPLSGHLAIYAGMKPRRRVEVLLSILGSAQRVTLAAGDVEPAPA